MRREAGARKLAVQRARIDEWGEVDAARGLRLHTGTSAHAKVRVGVSVRVSTAAHQQQHSCDNFKCRIDIPGTQY